MKINKSFKKQNNSKINNELKKSSTPIENTEENNEKYNKMELLRKSKKENPYNSGNYNIENNNILSKNQGNMDNQYEVEKGKENTLINNKRLTNNSEEQQDSTNNLKELKTNEVKDEEQKDGNGCCHCCPCKCKCSCSIF